MRLYVRYVTKEINKSREDSFGYIHSDWVKLKPLCIVRKQCGTGEAAKRFRYYADFKAPNDAKFTRNGIIRRHINRPLNPHFKPNKFKFIHNVHIIK